MPPLLNLEGHYSHIKNGRFYSTVHFLKYILPISARHRQPANSPTAARRPRLVTMVMLGHTDQQLSLLHLRPADSPLCRASIAGSHAPSRRPLAENSAPRPPLVLWIACLCVLARTQETGCDFLENGVTSTRTGEIDFHLLLKNIVRTDFEIVRPIFFFWCLEPAIWLILRRLPQKHPAHRHPCNTPAAAAAPTSTLPISPPSRVLHNPQTVCLGCCRFLCPTPSFAR